MYLLYAIEGTDKSGKETQSTNTVQILERIVNEAGLDGKIEFERISFPTYKNPSSFLVTENMEGKFGDTPDSVDPKMASLFYAVNRCHEYHVCIKPKILKAPNKHIIHISDRYVGSNLIHQGCKLKDRISLSNFMEFNNHIEYDICGIPKAEQTFFLNVPPEVSVNLRKNEKLKSGGEKDIYESDVNHTYKAFETARYIAMQENWQEINCTINGQFIEINEITHQIVKNIVIDILNKKDLLTIEEKQAITTIASTILTIKMEELQWNK